MGKFILLGPYILSVSVAPVKIDARFSIHGPRPLVMCHVPINIMVRWHSEFTVHNFHLMQHIPSYILENQMMRLRSLALKKAVQKVSRFKPTNIINVVAYKCVSLNSRSIL